MELERLNSLVTDAALKAHLFMATGYSEPKRVESVSVRLDADGVCSIIMHPEAMPGRVTPEKVARRAAMMKAALNAQWLDELDPAPLPHQELAHLHRARDREPGRGAVGSEVQGGRRPRRALRLVARDAGDARELGEERRGGDRRALQQGREALCASACRRTRSACASPWERRRSRTRVIWSSGEIPKRCMACSSGLARH